MLTGNTDKGSSHKIYSFFTFLLALIYALKFPTRLLQSAFSLISCPPNKIPSKSWEKAGERFAAVSSAAGENQVLNIPARQWQGETLREEEASRYTELNLSH